MLKTKIEWTDMTWNPITGCLHGCEYCYAEKIAKRFEGYWLDGLDVLQRDGYPYDPPQSIHGMDCEPMKERELSTPQLYKTKSGKYINAPFPYGFAPTLHRYRLDEPQRVKKPKTIFVCSMADLFGDWVPDEWIAEVFAACDAAPQHRYLFLTKNPKRYEQLEDKNLLPNGQTHFYGSTVTTSHDLMFTSNFLNTFVSVEPILEDFGNGGLDGIDWVIIGAETGSRKGNVKPKREWIENIVTACNATHTPIFMKDSLIPIVGAENMRREFPWERGGNENA